MINPVVYSISLDVHKIGSQKVLSMVRFDTKRTVVVSLTENGRPYTITEGCTAVFTAKKPDGTVIYNDCGIDYVNNTIVYPVTAQTTAVNGRVDCQLRLIGREGNIISSPTFTIVVADTLFNENQAVDSSDEFNKLTAYIAELEARAAAGEFDGKSIYIKGTVSSVEELSEKVSTAEAGDSYLTYDGHLHVFDGTSFVDTGRLQGERGVSGVYVGSGVPDDNYNVQIDPDGYCVTVDEALDENSSNPVANKAVKEAIDAASFVALEQVGYVAGDLASFKNSLGTQIYFGDDDGDRKQLISYPEYQVDGIDGYHLFAICVEDITQSPSDFSATLLVPVCTRSSDGVNFGTASVRVYTGGTGATDIMFTAEFSSNKIDVKYFTAENDDEMMFAARLGITGIWAIS